MAQNKNTTIDPAIIEAMDDILNNRSKLAEKIIDVLDNDVKTQEIIEKLICKYDEKQNRVFLRNWKNKIGYAIFTIIIALLSNIDRIVKAFTN